METIKSARTNKISNLKMKFKDKMELKITQ